MVQSHAMTATLREEIAGHLPRYDPLEEQRSYAGWVLAVISIALHLAVLFLFWDSVLIALQKLEDTVSVEMFEPEKPKLQRKVLAQTRVDTRVRQFKEIIHFMDYIKRALFIDRKDAPPKHKSNIETPK